MDIDPWYHCRPSGPMGCARGGRHPGGLCPSRLPGQRDAGAVQQLLDAGPAVVPAGCPSELGGHGTHPHLAPGREGSLHLPGLRPVW
ncbi:MAG: hypothetical protein ACLRWQ_18765 [Flavonifractor plautii]